MNAIRRWAVVVAFLFTAAGVAPNPLAAQTTPTDTAAVLYDVAVQLREEGRTEPARRLFDLIVERYPASRAAGRVRALLAAMPRGREEESGRTELVVWSTLYGLWLGAAVPAALDAQGPESYGLGLLLGGPAGFFLSKGYADRRGVGEGEARTITFGGSWGTWQAFGWQSIFKFGVDRESDLEEMLTAMIVGGVAGIVTGDLVGRMVDITPGTATAVNFGALWGTYYGWSTAMLFGLEDTWEHAFLGSALIGGNAGLLAAALLAPGWDVSRTRARLVSIAGVAGLVAGLGVDLLLQPDDRSVATAIPMATSALGLVAGALWTRDDDSDGAGAGGAGALLKVRDGRYALDVPAPVPALVPVEAAGTVRRRPGLRLNLVDARF